MACSLQVHTRLGLLLDEVCPLQQAQKPIVQQARVLIAGPNVSSGDRCTARLVRQLAYLLAGSRPLEVPVHDQGLVVALDGGQSESAYESIVAGIRLCLVHWGCSAQALIQLVQYGLGSHASARQAYTNVR